MPSPTVQCADVILSKTKKAQRRSHEFHWIVSVCLSFFFVPDREFVLEKTRRYVIEQPQVPKCLTKRSSVRVKCLRRDFGSIFVFHSTSTSLDDLIARRVEDICCNPPYTANCPSTEVEGHGQIPRRGQGCQVICESSRGGDDVRSSQAATPTRTDCCVRQLEIGFQFRVVPPLIRHPIRVSCLCPVGKSTAKDEETIPQN